MKKKAKEEINVKIDYNYPKATKVKIAKDKLYKETTVVRSHIDVLDTSLPITTLVSKVNDDILLYSSKIETIQRDFLFLKLFKEVAKKDELFEMELKQFEKYINKYCNDLDVVKNYFESIKNTDINIDTLVDLYSQVNSFYDFSCDLKDDLHKFRKKYYHEFKLSSYAIVQKKSIEEINEMISCSTKELSLYKSIEEANDYFIYNSGLLIQSVINDFCAIKNKNLTFHYFIQTDDIIAFNYNDWIELFVKFRYVLSKLKPNELSKSLKTKFQELEIRMVICTIYSELNRGK